MELNESLERITQKCFEFHQKIIYAINSGAISPSLGKYFCSLLNMDLIFNKTSVYFSNGLVEKANKFAIDLALEYSRTLLIWANDFIEPSEDHNELLKIAKNRFNNYINKLNQMNRNLEEN